MRSGPPARGNERPILRGGGLLTRDEGDQAVEQAVGWVMGDGGRFPGWSADNATLKSVFECSLITCPGLQLLPALAEFRLHWLTAGSASGKVWIRRWRRWLTVGRRIGDPLVVAPKGAVP